MHLIRYRVTNFRSVSDSGWIDANRVTALIGINESGKTNLLLPLWKLNPAGEGELKPNSDYPKGDYTDIRKNPKNYIFINAEFETGPLADHLAKISGHKVEHLRIAQVSKDFSGAFRINFPLYVPPKDLHSTSLVTLLQNAHDEIVGMAARAREASQKDAIVDAIATEINIINKLEEISANQLVETNDRLRAADPDNLAAATSIIVPRFRHLLEELGSHQNALSFPPPESSGEVFKEILAALPKFVYYSNYGNLDAEIYLPHVVDNLARSDLGGKEEAKARTLRVLFDFVGLKPEEILELGRDFRNTQRHPTDEEIAEIAEKKRERTNLLNSAETRLTKSFADWWKQGDYIFSFQADGDHFRIWVSDGKRPEKVELEDRSTGLQWFLCFYLVFLVEGQREHKNSILLLDEPGLSLHPLAQRDLSDFFDNLSRTNQLIFTTHSPFMVDADRLDRVRKVFVSEDGSTKASADLRRGNSDPRQQGATYAIYSALNMSIAESILLGCLPVIVEGPSDQHYLTAIKTILIAEKCISPKRELVFPPAHGANNAKVIASVLAGRNEELPYVLLDGDAAGQKMSRDLQNGVYQSAKARVIITDHFVGYPNSEIEDLFSSEFLAGVIDRWERRPETSFSDFVRAGAPIVPQIEAWAQENEIELPSGWKVEVARRAKERALLPSTTFDTETLARWTSLFEVIAASTAKKGTSGAG
ncbi:AAA family ATPase [Acidomonas methanolica]|uniref:Endonuclease GajA/Old nuclease/RecF-like AAA domain-containing protein n=1 Tax=Acidomonas methanolica NBRC 104435 TaxID=1231351 RepID=A0A023D8S6_ACIMT|nr:AAA family ATPase [Acidomonas methanolica]MBU2653053.1 ATP-binding protein [Acidomonas methanolica]TCS27171.1 AAA ATPase-like protein [Acidomonas methanolica]GAJ30140.1 hypothetical protein Amme_105_002 [Acidomonas methanolica NBRC 104435]GBQ46743.1 hypothetical protein AA0498_0362 [Acidomonas methanolica]GEL00308.1 hypothetical protein AME01nite_28060 [Acidomonas methanolica NBRC 104435]